MATNPVRRIRGTGPLTPEEVAREQAVRRQIYAEFPSLRMVRYRDLARKLAQARRINEGHGSGEEDALLEEMDLIWSKLTAEERDVIGQERVQALKHSPE
jgi:hypothetical protein